MIHSRCPAKCFKLIFPRRFSLGPVQRSILREGPSADTRKIMLIFRKTIVLKTTVNTPKDIVIQCINRLAARWMLL